MKNNSNYSPGHEFKNALAQFIPRYSQPNNAHFQFATQCAKLILDRPHLFFQHVMRNWLDSPTSGLQRDSKYKPTIVMRPIVETYSIKRLKKMDEEILKVAPHQFAPEIQKFLESGDSYLKVSGHPGIAFLRKSQEEYGYQVTGRSLKQPGTTDKLVFMEFHRDVNKFIERKKSRQTERHQLNYCLSAEIEWV